MAVSQIKRVQIFAHNSHRASLVKDLQGLEIIHIINLNEQKESAEEIPTETETKKLSRDIQNDLSRLQSAINYLASFEQKKGMLASFIGNKPVLSSQQYAKIADEADGDEWRNICDECQSMIDQSNRLSGRQTRLQSEREILSLWSGLDASIEEIRDTEKTAIRMGVVPVNAYDNLIADVEEMGLNVVFEVVGRTNTEVNIVVIFLKSVEQKATSLLTKHGFSPVSLPVTSGKVSDQLKRIGEELSEISAQRNEISKKSAELAEHREKLMAIYDYLRELMEREQIRESFAHTEHTFMIDGWVRKRDIKKLTDMLSEKYDESEIIISDPAEDDKPPVDLENGKLADPFQMVTRLYGIPNYGELDPTPLIAPFVAFFFGICLTDAGYGLVIAVLAYLIARRMVGGNKRLFKLLIIAGLVTMLVGALTGGWFGIDSDKLPSFLTKIRLLDPKEQQMKFLVAIVILGFIQVWFGFFVKMIVNIKDRDWVGAFLDQLPWLLGMIFLPVAALLFIMTEALSIAIVFAVAFILCCLVIVLFAGRENKNPIVRVAAGGFEFYSRLTGTFGDVLSYLRLFALGLATGIIGSVVNTMAGMMWGNPMGKVVAVGILAGGHLFNILINALGGFIHTMRLQFVEFFTKFYEGGGEQFLPFRKEHTYITVSDMGNPQVNK